MFCKRTYVVVPHNISHGSYAYVRMSELMYVYAYSHILVEDQTFTHTHVYIHASVKHRQIRA